MMNKKGDFNIVAMIIGVITVGLFFTTFGFFITSNANLYDASGYDNETFNKFIDESDNVTLMLEEQSEVIDKQANVDENAFDYVASIFNKVLRPFKFIYRSFESVISMSKVVVKTFNLPDFFIDYFISLIIVLVVVGVVLLNLYLGRQK